MLRFLFSQDSLIGTTVFHQSILCTSGLSRYKFVLLRKIHSLIILSDKSLSFQLAIGFSFSSFIPSICGFAAGALYYINLGGIRRRTVSNNCIDSYFFLLKANFDFLSSFHL